MARRIEDLKEPAPIELIAKIVGSIFFLLGTILFIGFYWAFDNDGETVLAEMLAGFISYGIIFLVLKILSWVYGKLFYKSHNY